MAARREKNSMLRNLELSKSESLKKDFKGIIARLDFYPLARFTLWDFKVIEVIKESVREEGGDVSPKDITTLEAIESRVRRPV